jgi:hypothetical protein
VLRSDGIAGVGFGAVADEAVAALIERFGQPDSDVVIGPDRDCVEGSPWRDCVVVAREGRIISWSEHGLDVLLTDADAGREVSPLHLGSWHAVPAPTEPPLATSEGLSVRAEVADVRRTYPDAEFFANEGIVDLFQAATASGTYLGTLAWASFEDHVRSLQRSLNARGAGLVVDGIPGPRTEQACADIARAEGLAGQGCPGGWLTTELADAIGFPPSDVRIASLSASE